MQRDSDEADGLVKSRSRPSRLCTSLPRTANAHEARACSYLRRETVCGQALWTVQRWRQSLHTAPSSLQPLRFFFFSPNIFYTGGHKYCLRMDIRLSFDTCANIWYGLPSGQTCVWKGWINYHGANGSECKDFLPTHASPLTLLFSRLVGIDGSCLNPMFKQLHC